MHVAIQLFQHYFLTKLFFIEWSWYPCWKLVDCITRIYFWTFNSVSLTSMFILISVPHCLDYCYFLLFWNWNLGVFQLYFVLFHFLSFACFKIILTIEFHINFRIGLSVFIQKPANILRFNCIKSVGQFGDYCHFNNITSSNSWTWDTSIYVMLFISTMFCSFYSISLHFFC